MLSRASAPAGSAPLGAGFPESLGSISHSYGNVSNYRTELLAGAEDPVGRPMSARCRREEREAAFAVGSPTNAALVRRGEEARKEIVPSLLRFNNIHASSADRNADVESGNRTI